MAVSPIGPRALLAVAAMLALAAGALVACIVVPPPLALADTAADEEDEEDEEDDGRDGQGDVRPETTTPKPLIAELACGERHCCVRTHDGRVACWGDRQRAQLGDEAASGAGVAQLVPGRYTHLALGARHACALDAAGDMTCWGDNEGQQAANDFGVLTVAPPRVYDFTRTAPGARTLASLAPGRGRSQCGVVATPAAAAGDLVCWGVRLSTAATPIDANAGLLARGPAETTWSAADVGAADAACLGESHACLRLDTTGSGLVLCWGHGDDGQLGHGQVGGWSAPTLVAGLGDVVVTELACGLRHTCVRGQLRADGAPVVRCFGANAAGQAGRAPPADVLAPNDVVLPAAATALSAGRAHTCALAGERLYCWGDDTHSQLGPDAPGGRWLPAEVPLAFIPRLLAVGDDVTCTSDGAAVWCFGSDAWGQLGTGTYGVPERSTPSLIELPL